MFSLFSRLCPSQKLFLLVCLLLALFQVGRLYAAPGTAVLLELKGPIGPASVDFVSRGFHTAEKRGAKLIILRIDTPGGLSESMRNIISDILNSKIPVASFVAPSGARAASAGTYIMYASQVAAMAPATNLGAASPVKIGGVPGLPEGSGKKSSGDKGDADIGEKAMARKIVNDSVAYIQGLARLHGRNAEWAEKAVRVGASLPVDEAVKMHVVDLKAENVEDLLRKIDGRTVRLGDHKVTLKTRNLVVERIEPDWRSELLGVITNPTIIPILMMLGTLGLLYEIWSPGAVLPGVVGAICLLIALYAVQALPINYAGLGLILLGIAFMVAEVFAPSFGALGIGGIVAFVAGSVMLMDSEVEGYQVYWPAILGIGVAGALSMAAIGGFAMRARNRRIVSGQEEMVGMTGHALESFEHRGRIRVHSEEWQAQSDQPVMENQLVQVVRLEGLVAIIKPVEPESKEES